MITRARLEAVTAEVLDTHAGECRVDHRVIASKLADALGLEGRPPIAIGIAEPRSYLFVRQTKWVGVDIARRFDGLIVAVRSNGRPIGRDPAWWVRMRDGAGRQMVGFDWMPERGAWRPGLAQMVDFLATAGAKALCLNVEPLPADALQRWEGHHTEAARFVAEARDLCDRRRLQLWFTSWAKPSARRDFPWLEFVRAAHVCIPQPYEVHGRTGAAYIADVIDEWTDLGAKKLIIGRGAHELDKSDDDAWRTVDQIRQHRETTPTGMAEAWWPPAGDMAKRTAIVEAMTERR
jgi:hypothetical protein